LFIPSFHQPTFLKNILRQRKYSVFILSILSSILIANIIDDVFKNTYSIPKIIVTMMMIILYISKHI
jgi:hypothetical protein